MKLDFLDIAREEALYFYVRADTPDLRVVAGKIAVYWAGFKKYEFKKEQVMERGFNDALFVYRDGRGNELEVKSIREEPRKKRKIWWRKPRTIEGIDLDKVGRNLYRVHALVANHKDLKGFIKYIEEKESEERAEQSEVSEWRVED